VAYKTVVQACIMLLLGSGGLAVSLRRGERAAARS